MLAARFRAAAIPTTGVGPFEIINGNKKELQAVVIGSDTYEVDLYREGDTIYVSCTCPYFEGERETCKHIWATLLAAEKQGYLRGKSNSDPAHLEIDVDNDDWEENVEGDWDEDEELEDEDVIRPGYAATSSFSAFPGTTASSTRSSITRMERSSGFPARGFAGAAGRRERPLACDPADSLFCRCSCYPRREGVGH